MKGGTPWSMGSPSLYRQVFCQNAWYQGALKFAQGHHADPRRRCTESLTEGESSKLSGHLSKAISSHNSALGAIEKKRCYNHKVQSNS